MVTGVQLERLLEPSLDAALDTLSTVNSTDILESDFEWWVPINIAAAVGLYELVTEELDQRGVPIGVAENLVDHERLESEAK